MSDNDKTSQEWAKTKMEEAVNEVLSQGIFKGARVEARIVWSLQQSIVIGQIREKIDPSSFRWLITGEDVPTDHLDGQAADSPRDALRHICLKWQLGAERVTEASKNDPDTGDQYRARAAKLSKQAADLYELAEADELWPEQ